MKLKKCCVCGNSKFYPKVCNNCKKAMTSFNNIQKNKNWEDEFNLLFPRKTIFNYFNTVIQNKILEALETQKKEFVSLIESKKKKTYWSGQNHTPPKQLINNKVLDNLLKQIKEL